MSGGEPSSIKRSVLCAAASLHTYVSDFLCPYAESGEILRYILKRLKKLLKAILPLYAVIAAMNFYVSMVVFGRPVSAPLAMSAFLAFVFLLVTAAVLYSDYTDYRRNNPDGNLIKNSFGTFANTRTTAFHLGVERLRSGSYAQALEFFDTVSEYELEQREEALVCFYRAECYRFMGYNTNAAMWYVKAIENDIDEDFVYILAARCYTNAASYSSAMELYRTAESKGFLYDCIYTDMGMCCIKAEKPDEAMNYFNLSVQTGRNLAFALGGCAIAYIMKKDVEMSREFYCKALVSGMTDVKGFIEYYRGAAEASGCTEKIKEFAKLTFDSEDVKQ